jgi:ribosomal protein L11 methyltransferase
VNRTFSLHLHPEMSSDSAWILLQSQGIEVLFAEEEEGLERLVIKTSLPAHEILEKFTFIKESQEITLPEMNWEAEWQLHAPGFSDGKLPLDFKPYGADRTLYLVPGAGFGDLSHPTTRLVLELMKGRMVGKDVVDIGSGSGVLSIAAQALGARSVFGIDIYHDANVHAAENALLNGFPEVKFYLPEEVPVLKNFSGVILMNMITTEQKEAWRSFSKGRQVSGIALTSGILKEQEEEYRALVEGWGWRVDQVIEEGSWLGVFSSMPL